MNDNILVRYYILSSLTRSLIINHILLLSTIHLALCNHGFRILVSYGTTNFFLLNKPSPAIDLWPWNGRVANLPWRIQWQQHHLFQQISWHHRHPWEQYMVGRSSFSASWQFRERFCHLYNVKRCHYFSLIFKW